MDLKHFIRLPIMGILRGVERDLIRPLVETLVSSGLKTIEIAMNTPDAARLIQEARKIAGQGLTIGAGTVLGLSDLNKALDSGASFIVLPVFVENVVKQCVRKKIPVFPGALTPQEIYHAWQEGATMVKVFPSRFFGPDYLREIKGPFQDVRLLACGGVNSFNIKSFFSSGASAVAFGSGIFKSEWLKRHEFQRIKECVKELISASGYKTK